MRTWVIQSLLLSCRQCWERWHFSFRFVSENFGWEEKERFFINWRIFRDDSRRVGEGMMAFYDL